MGSTALLFGPWSSGELSQTPRPAMAAAWTPCNSPSSVRLDSPSPERFGELKMAVAIFKSLVALVQVCFLHGSRPSALQLFSIDRSHQSLDGCKHEASLTVSEHMSSATKHSIATTADHKEIFLRGHLAPG